VWIKNVIASTVGGKVLKNLVFGAFEVAWILGNKIICGTSVL